MLSIGASAAATNAKNFPDLQQLTFQNIGQLFLTASEAISKYGGAKIGQKTVIDMLEPLGRYRGGRKNQVHLKKKFQRANFF